jgi:putative Mn2+ efflux pump MntP
MELFIMGLLEIVIIALSLSMDAFAVSITLGLSVKKPKIIEILLPGIYFGIFQAFMPIIGYIFGMYFVNYIAEYAHWIAFVLLGIIGGKMIKDSISNKENIEHENKNAFKFVKMLILAFATSIDALAIGVTFAIFMINIIKAVIIIGSITFFVSMAGVKIGNIFGIKYKSKAEFIGGAVLIILGIKMVIENII